jgi:anti-sigma factor RsiW
MNTVQSEHPAEEVLLAIAMDGNADPEANRHITECPACARFIKEITALKSSIVALPDVTVPANLRKAILNPKKWNHLPVLFTLSPATLLKNPFVLGFALVLVILFLYIFYVFLM